MYDLIVTLLRARVALSAFREFNASRIRDSNLSEGKTYLLEKAIVSKGFGHSKKRQGQFYCHS